MPEQKLDRLEFEIFSSGFERNTRQLSLGRVGYNTFTCGIYFTAIASAPFIIGLLLESFSPDVIKGNLDDALYIFPRIIGTGFLTSFILSGTTELIETQGRKLAQEVLIKSRKYKEENFTSLPKVPEISSHQSRLEDSLSWNILKAAL